MMKDNHFRGNKGAVLLFCLGYFLLFLQSMNAWFFWTANQYLAPALCLMMSIPLIINLKPDYSYFNTKTVIPALLLCIAKYLSLSDFNTTSLIGALLSLVPIIILLPQKEQVKSEVLAFITNGLAFLLVPALLIWILLLANVSLPNLGIISNAAWDKYVYFNYFFCLKNIPLYTNRFHAVFLEPGHLGMMTSFLLLANRFDFKARSVQIIIIATLFTLSLAAYVLTIASLAIYLLFYSRNGLVYLVSSVFLLFIAYSFFSTYKNGNNIVNERIIERLQYDENKGVAGNNRSTRPLDTYYDQFITKPQRWFGIGSTAFTNKNFGPSAGYKVYLTQHGIIGVFAVFLFYLSVLITSKSRFLWGLFIIYIITFLQRAYPLWACELIVFIVASQFKSLPKNVKYINVVLTKVQHQPPDI